MSTQINDGYIYGLTEILKGTISLGYLSEDGLSFGGEEPEEVEIWAAQQKDAPIKIINKRNGTTELSGTIIELTPEKCKAALGGYTDAKGWAPAANFAANEDKITVKCDSGHTIVFWRAKLSGKLSGAINGDDVSKIEFKIKALSIPGKLSYKIYSPGQTPDVEAPAVPAPTTTLLT